MKTTMSTHVRMLRRLLEMARELVRLRGAGPVRSGHCRSILPHEPRPSLDRWVERLFAVDPACGTALDDGDPVRHVEERERLAGCRLRAGDPVHGRSPAAVRPLSDRVAEVDDEGVRAMFDGAPRALAALDLQPVDRVGAEDGERPVVGVRAGPERATCGFG